MELFHHKNIKRFDLNGSIHDEMAIPRLKREYVLLLRSQMQDLGYVERYDIDTNFTISYNEQEEIFEFDISMYGIYVGKNKAKCITGIDGTRPIYIQKSKSKEFSME